MATRRATCTMQRCKRPMRVGLWCKKHATDKCDELFSLLIRSRGGCEAAGDHKGVLQCAHGFSRSYHAVRWDTHNAFSLCAGHHLYYTLHPLEWDDWLLERWGHELYWEIRALALTHRWPDLEVIYADLTRAYERREVTF